MTETRLDLVGVADICGRLGVSRDAVYKWRKRYADFPEPYAVLDRGAVWVWEEVEAWVAGRAEQQKARKTGDRT